MKHIIRHATLSGIFALASLGCGEPLKEAQRIEEPRVLGVRIEGESGSSEVAPGEQMELTLLLAGPEGPVDAEIAFRACVGKGTERGVPECGEAPFLEGTALASDFPFSAELPLTIALGARIVILGVACVGSEPSFAEDPRDWRCRDGDSPLRFSFETTAASGSERNRNPELEEVTAQISGTSLQLDDTLAAPSCEQDRATVAADQTHEMRIELGPEAFEAGEELQVSLFSTGGHLDRQFTFLEQGQTSFLIEFEASSAEKALKQYLVVRDSRGGVSWVTWSFCQR